MIEYLFICQIGGIYVYTVNNYKCMYKLIRIDQVTNI